MAGGQPTGVGHPDWIPADPSAGDDLSTDKYRTRTKDGIDVGVAGQWRYTLNVDPAVLEAFDAKFGTRTYAVPGSDERIRVADGDQGVAGRERGQRVRADRDRVGRRGSSKGTMADRDRLRTCRVVDAGKMANRDIVIAGRVGVERRATDREVAVFALAFATLKLLQPVWVLARRFPRRGSVLMRACSTTARTIRRSSSTTWANWALEPVSWASATTR